MNTRYMPDIKNPTTKGKIQSPNLSCNPLCNVNIFIRNRFFGLQIIHPNEFEMHVIPKQYYFNVYINQQILAIALEFTYAPIYI